MTDRYTTTLPGPGGRAPGWLVWLVWPGVVDDDRRAAGLCLFDPATPGPVGVPPAAPPVPEPSAGWLGALGLAALWAHRRMRRWRDRPAPG